MKIKYMKRNNAQGRYEMKVIKYVFDMLIKNEKYTIIIIVK